MSDLALREQQAHRRSVEMGVADVVGYLQDALGQKLVAFMAGVSDEKAVGQWARQRRKPQPDAERRLRAAYQVFHLLHAHDSGHVVRAWFVGLNPQLADASPVETIREGHLRDVVAAARAFIEGG